MRIRVLTINVQNDEGDPRRAQILAAGLRHLEPDLVAFQEVLREPGRDQLGELLAGTDLHGTHQADALAYRPPFADRYGGNAVATRWTRRPSASGRRSPWWTSTPATAASCRP